MSGSDARALARSLLDLCRSRRLTIATAESCTGGLVAGALTDIPGSSDVIDRGFVTYSNEAKRAMLGVEASTLATFGAVSKETATQMAVGALERADVDLAVVEALRMLMELARGPQQVKPKRAAVSRIRPRVTRTPRRHAVKRRRPPRG
jgi:nicotinamide-nucleotide amidase